MSHSTARGEGLGDVPLLVMCSSPAGERQIRQANVHTATGTELTKDLHISVPLLEYILGSMLTS